MRAPLYFGIIFAAIAAVGLLQSWNVAFAILNLCLISSVMALGVNIQWGYAGLFNVGIMGFSALGGAAAMLIAVDPVPEAWAAGGVGVLLSGVVVGAVAALIWVLRNRMGLHLGPWLTAGIVIAGYIAARMFFDPATEAIEKVDPATSGYLGGLGLPILVAWGVGGVIAAGAAWAVGKIALGLRSDYLAIATLGISEIIIAVLKNEDWLTRGVKNVAGLPRPVPYEVDLAQSARFQEWVATLGVDPATAGSIFVKLCYASQIIACLAVLMWLSERAIKSPWGRMMRAIRDNRDAASAMGKNVTARHLQVFVLGSAVCGIAGAMLTTLDGQFTPTSYIPLRFTFLIWVMVILGGSGNNWGSVLGGFVIWFVWIEAEPAGLWLMSVLTAFLPEGNAVRDHLLEAAPHMRLFLMGLILLLVMRFAPRGLLPERH